MTATGLDVQISEVWRMLGGPPLRHGRGRAFWRDGNGLNVAIDDEKGVWMDHADGVGGGILDLISRVRGGSRSDALRWLADASGVTLATPKADPWAWIHRDAIAQDGDNAHYWRRGILNVLDEILTSLKCALFDSGLPQPESDEILNLECLCSGLRDAGDFALVQEYRSWLSKWPETTAAVAHAARGHEAAEKRTIAAFIRSMEGAR
ncbi:MAG TPA: hypothetical protein VKB79_17395 [Bryobacteraceae bacterium]|nr:hypothetical protein [Bryobacteraceae bacterium]